MKEVDLMCSMHCSGLDPCNSGRSAHPYGPCGCRGVIWLTNASDQIPFDVLTGALSIGPLHGWATLIGLIPCSRRIPSCEHMSLCVLFHFRSDVTTAASYLNRSVFLRNSQLISMDAENSMTKLRIRLGLKHLPKKQTSRTPQVIGELLTGLTRINRRYSKHKARKVIQASEGIRKEADELFNQLGSRLWPDSDERGDFPTWLLDSSDQSSGSHRLYYSNRDDHAM
jgi:hypothetical protein